MLFIHTSLALGGVETFYVRMAKARHKMKLNTSILLLSNKKKSNSDLLLEVARYASIYFIDDYVNYGWMKLFPYHFTLLKTLNKNKFSKIIKNIERVHVGSSLLGIFAEDIKNKFDLKFVVTAGVYHSKEYVWGWGEGLPYYEKVNREYFSNILLNKAGIVFNDLLSKKYALLYNTKIDDANIFPLGVVEKSFEMQMSDEEHAAFRIVSVGRLVEFKSYNIWMLDVISALSKNFPVEYHIYGNGPMIDQIKEKIRDLNLSKFVFLKGDLNYLDFDAEISTFDLFVGSGTSVVQSSSLGVPSIVGIESVDQPLSYGFMCDIKGFSYNEDGLWEKKSVYELIDGYIRSTDKIKYEICERHVSWANRFSMNSCVLSFEDVFDGLQNNQVFPSIGMMKRVIYSFSFLFFSLNSKIFNNGLNSRIYN